jgi:hypothetical protein
MFLKEYTNVINNIKANVNSKYLDKYLLINFKNGPEGVKKDVLSINAEIIKNNDQDQLILIIEQFSGLFDKISWVIGDWVSAFIPDDAGIIGTLISVTLPYAGSNSYTILSTLFNKIPNKYSELLRDSDKLKVFLYSISEDIEIKLKEKLHTANNTILSKLSKYEKLATFLSVIEKYGIDKSIISLLIDYLSTKYTPQIDKAVKLLYSVLPMMFIILVLRSTNNYKK